MMNDIQLAIILGFYYVGKEKNIERFTSLFNSCFGQDVGMQMIMHEVAIFRNVDPKYNRKYSTTNKKYYDIWNEYIIKDKVHELSLLYRSFWLGDFISHDKEKKDKNNISEFPKEVVIIDEPKQIREYVENSIVKFYRDQSVVENALAAAKYLCEGKCGCELFYRKDGKTYYTEAHHLIPLKFQKFFNVSLDVEANVVSLCPRCHRLLHHGNDIKALLKALYDSRVERLRACGIDITFEKLLLLYAANDIEDEYE